ncbi:MAG: hypothetical protein JXP36_19030 [Bacteroidales bacterium]|nr:hypothetical protein [Bacteroidales bacterium]
MIPVPVIQGAATALGVGSKIFSAIRGGQANESTQNLINRQIQDNESFYNNRVNRDFMETNVAKGLAERLRKNLEKSNKTVESKSASLGGTAEAEIAAKSRNQENYNDAINQLAGQATQYQQGQEAIYQNAKNNTMNAQIGLNQQKANNAANIASNADQLISGAMSLSGGETATSGEPILNQFGRTQEQEEALRKISQSAFNS